MPATIVVGGAALSVAAVISLVYQLFCKALVQAGIARLTSNPDVQNALERLVICALGSIVGVVAYGLQAPHPTGHDTIVAALAGSGEAVTAIILYHLAPLPGTAIAAVLGARADGGMSAASGPPIVVTPLAPPVPAIEQPAPAPAAPVQAVATEAPAVV